MIDKLIKPVSDIVGKFVKDKDLQAQLDPRTCYFISPSKSCTN